MNLVEAIKKRHKVLTIIQAQDPAFESISLSCYRVAYLQELEQFISGQIKNISHDNYSTESSATYERPLGMDRKQNKEGSGNSSRPMGFNEFKENRSFRGCELFRRKVKATIHKITLIDKGGYTVL